MSPMWRVLDTPVLYELNQKNLLTRRLRRIIGEYLLSRGGGRNPGVCLDVGCGTGVYLDVLEGRCIGTDVNVRYMTFLGRRRKRVFASDATRLGVRSGVIDFVFCISVLHHLDDRRARMMLKEMWRVCKRGGRVFILDAVYPPSRMDVLGRLLRRLDRGRYMRERDAFKVMLGEFEAEVGGRLELIDFRSWPHYGTIGIMLKDFIGSPMAA